VQDSDDDDDDDDDYDNSNSNSHGNIVLYQPNESTDKRSITETA
jgi:hypothetical protein